MAKRELKPLNVNPEPVVEAMTEVMPAPKVDDTALAAILGDGRDVADYSEGGPPFLPYKRGFDADVTIDSLEIKKNQGGSAGVFINMTVDAVADHQGQQEPDPQEPKTWRVEVGKDYVQAWFTKHSSMEDYVLKAHRRSMREFAAEVTDNDPNSIQFDDFVALKALHVRTARGEKLGLKFRVSNTFERRTRNGVALYKMTYTYLFGEDAETPETEETED